MRNPKVFIPQEPRKRDLITGEFQAMYDLTPARHFGDLEILLPHGPMLLDTDLIIETLMGKMYDYTNQDFIMCVGDPAAIVVSALCACKINNFNVNLLRYSRKEKLYVPSKWVIF